RSGGKEEEIQEMTKSLLCGALCADTIADIRPGQLRDRPYAEKQRKPDDMEAQEGQRRIAIHALENRGYSDIGVTLLRRMLRESVRAVKNGKDPQNYIRDPEQNHALETSCWNT